jgi:hypothetical protein
MTPCDVASRPGELTLSGGFLTSGKVRVSFPENMKVEKDAVPTTDARLRPIWGERIYRVRLMAEKLPAKGEFVVRIAQV